MRVSTRTVVVYLLASGLMSAAVSFVVYLARFHSDHPVLLTISFLLMFIFILTGGILIKYHYSLDRAKRNLDEAQKLAGIGSWERDLTTGRGYWSDNRFRMFGMQPSTKAPNHDEFFDMINPDDRNYVRSAIEAAVRSGNSYDVTFRQAGDIHNRIFLSRGLIMLDESGKPVKIVGTTQDITEKCRQEDFLRDMVIQKSQLITRLGHDLKTPLTPLIALLPMIRSRVSDEKLQSLIDMCIQSSANILKLVSRDMDLARRSSSHRPDLQMTDVALAAFVDDFLATTGSRINNLGLHISSHIGRDMVVHADRSELEELLRNLISNAVKFSPPQSPVNIEAELQNNQVCVKVIDAGIGLAPEEKALIFDEFYKADESRHELGSSGLGLAICRQIVENHGGRIWAESEGKGHGTSISFTLESGGRE